MVKILGSDLAALLATLFCVWLLRPLAIRVGFVDRPGGRKQHDAEVPLIGGIAVFFGFCFALLLLPVSLHHYRGLIAGASLLVLMGIVDDFRELGWKLRLFGQVLAALAMILWGHHRIVSFGNLCFFGNIELGIASVPVTVIAIVGFLNAMNMIDGQDGLFGGVALGQVLLLMFLSSSLFQGLYSAVLGILALTILVFLSFNMRLPWRKKASIFMGDTGSTMIAFLVAWFAITIGQRRLDQVQPMAILWILSFPIFDFFNVFFHRVLNGKSPLHAGRDHFHHVLNFIGFDVTLSTLLLSFFSLMLGVVGVAFNLLPLNEGYQFGVWLITLLIYFFIVKVVRNQHGQLERYVCSKGEVAG